MDSFEQLIAEHDALDRLSERLGINASADPFDGERLAADLNILVKAVAAHLQHEDPLLYTILVRRAGGGSETVERLMRDYTSLCAEWQVYAAKWGAAGAIAGDRGGFRTETEGMVPRLRSRVNTETELLYGTALRDGLISLRRH